MQSIAQLKTHSIVAACLTGPPYTGENKELPISACLGDNTFSVQNFSINTLGLDANVCQTHTSAIAANNGTYKEHFHDMAIYEEFYEYICRISRLFFNHAGTHIQEILVEWLKARLRERVRLVHGFASFWLLTAKDDGSSPTSVLVFMKISDVVEAAESGGCRAEDSD